MLYPSVRRRVFTRENVWKVEDEPGVYVLFYYGKPILVGESEDVYSRLLTHVGKKEAGNLDATQFSVYYVWEVGDRKQLEADLIHRHHPRLNKRCPKTGCDHYQK